MSDDRSAKPFVNIHGRKGTRGLRPWLLIPKVLAVGVYFGGQVAAVAVWFTPFPTKSSAWLVTTDVPALIIQADLVGALYRFVIVPALLVAVLFGALLLCQHPGPFLRMRWLRLKLAIAALAVPAAHIFMSSRLQMIRNGGYHGVTNASAIRQFTLAMLAMIVITALLIALGRQKPRLGQNWARDYPERPQ